MQSITQLFPFRLDWWRDWEIERWEIRFGKKFEEIQLEWNSKRKVGRRAEADKPVFSQCRRTGWVLLKIKTKTKL